MNRVKRTILAIDCGRDECAHTTLSVAKNCLNANILRKKKEIITVDGFIKFLNSRLPLKNILEEFDIPMSTFYKKCLNIVSNILIDQPHLQIKGRLTIRHITTDVHNWTRLLEQKRQVLNLELSHLKTLY